MVQKTNNEQPARSAALVAKDWSKPWVSPDFNTAFEGMEPTPDATDEITQQFEENSPAYQKADAIDRDIAVAQGAESELENKAVVKEMGDHAPDPHKFDLQAPAQAEGPAPRPVQVEDGSWDVPNAMIKPRSVEIAGYDMATGEMVRNVLPNAGDHIHEALSQIRASKTNSAGQAMIGDTLPLTQLAYEFIRHDMDFEGFVAQMPESFNREHLATAYRVADEYNIMNTVTGASWAQSDLKAAEDAMPPEKWNLTDQDLQENEVWMNSARIMYRNLEGEEFKGSDEELFEKSKTMMSLFNWSAYNMGMITRDVVNGPDDMKRAMHYMSVLYEQKDTTVDDVLNNLIAIGADPATYLSLGFGKVAIQGAQTLFKKELGKRLAMYVGAAGTGAGEGAAYTGFDDFNRQTVEVEAGAKKEHDAWQTAVAAGTGAAVGTVLGPAVVFGGEQLVKYGTDLSSRVKQMRANPDTPARGPMARQSGRIGFDNPTPDEAAGKGVSSIDIIDQDVAPFKPSPEDIRSPNKQVGSYIQKRADEALQGRDLTQNTPENKAFISDVLAREVKAEMLKDRNKGRASSAQWYRDTLDAARAEIGRVHPEIVSDPVHRTAFDFALAITSNGQKVSDNTKYAINVYEYWKKTGLMPEHSAYGKGKEASAMTSHFKLYNDLQKAWGTEKLHNALATEYPVRVLKDMGFDIADEGAEAMLPLSVVFGSKIGGGFFSNLQGDWTRLTPDRWFARTWGRVTGTMMVPKPELAQKHYNEFRANYVANKKTVKGYLGYAPKIGELTDEKIDEIGQQIFAKWSRAKGPDGKSFPDKSNPMHTISRSIDNRLKPRESPAGTGERQMMRETIQEVQAKLATDGVDLNVSDIQAILWYPEQRLWDQLGSKQTGKENDYARAAREYLRTDPRAVSQGGAEGVQQASAETGFAGSDKTTFAKTETLRDLRAGSRRRNTKGSSGPVYGQAGSTAKSVQLAGSSAKVVKTHKTSKAAANRLERINVSTEPWHELEPSLASSQSFQKAITKSQKDLGPIGKSVYVYDPVDLQDAKMFVSGDGKAGFAIKPDGDIVSVFNSSDRPNSAISGLLLAVEQGGTKLDAFDTMLPRIYSQAGFKVVKREPWNDAFAPEGWDYKYFKEYNNGRPDIVYMEYDPTSSGTYIPGDTGQ